MKEENKESLQEKMEIILPNSLCNDISFFASIFQQIISFNRKCS